MIRMGKEVGRELVIIPHKTVVDIMSDTAPTNLGKIFLHHISVEPIDGQIESETLHGSLKIMFFTVSGSCPDIHRIREMTIIMGFPEKKRIGNR